MSRNKIESNNSGRVSRKEKWVAIFKELWLPMLSLLAATIFLLSILYNLEIIGNYAAEYPTLALMGVAVIIFLFALIYKIGNELNKKNN